MDLLVDIRNKYRTDRSVFVDGADMVDALTILGACESDFDAIKTVSSRLSPDPTLPFRESKNGRFHIDTVNSKVRRLESQPFVLSAEEDFVRHDSGKKRTFAEIGNDLQHNSVLKALLLFKVFVVHGAVVNERPGLDYNKPGWICTLFNLRTITHPGAVGEPALEGVHSDGVDHTMATFLGSQNMAPTGAKTFIHDMREQNSIRWHEADPELVRGEAQHRNFLDTLMVVDHERKHSVSPLEPLDPQKTATRDMLIFFTRKPTVSGHISHKHDSTVAHSTMPMVVDIPECLDMPGAGRSLASERV
ncbi:2OG-Fe dioxygenase family protein [Streptomyces flavidovirens]|uniref:2OG-Fe dioxygenase family protein n=1 Tax=Streptomyces flavidovirens TaxID=67298 RepID=UPI001AD80984|nr:2OG-Fe dioxygenase family protein [Streptomyces flavidovirens]